MWKKTCWYDSDLCAKTSYFKDYCLDYSLEMLKTWHLIQEKCIYLQWKQHDYSFFYQVSSLKDKRIVSVLKRWNALLSIDTFNIVQCSLCHFTPREWELVRYLSVAGDNGMGNRSSHREPTSRSTQGYDGETIWAIIPWDKWPWREKVSDKAANSLQSGIWGKIIALWLNWILGHLLHSNEMVIVVTLPLHLPDYFLPDYRAGSRGDYLPTGIHLKYVCVGLFCQCKSPIITGTSAYYMAAFTWGLTGVQRDVIKENRYV